MLKHPPKNTEITKVNHLKNPIKSTSRLQCPFSRVRALAACLKTFENPPEERTCADTTHPETEGFWSQSQASSKTHNSWSDPRGKAVTAISILSALSLETNTLLCIQYFREKMSDRCFNLSTTLRKNLLTDFLIVPVR